MFYLGAPEYRPPSAQLVDLLPWALLEAPGVLRLKDGSLQRTLHYRGHDPARLTDEERMVGHAQLNAALLQLGEGWSVWSELRREPLLAPARRHMQGAAAGLVEAIRHENFLLSGQLYTTRAYLTLVKTPPNPAARRLTGRVLALFGGLFEGGGTLARDPERARVEARGEEVEGFARATREFLDATRGLFAQAAWLDDEGTLGYLHEAISRHRHPVRCPEVPMYLDALLADEPLQAGLELRIGEEHLRVISIKGYPAMTHPHLLHGLETAPFPLRLVQRWIGLGQAEAQAALKRYQNLLLGQTGRLNPVQEKGSVASVNHAAVEAVGSVSAQLMAVEQQRRGFGYHSCVVVVRDREAASCRERAEQVMALFRAAGFVCVEETAGCKGAWLSSLPGHLWANPRRALLSSQHLGHMLPTQSLWQGAAWNAHLDGPPHVACATTGATPFWLNLNVGDVGHTLILGPTGAGKSTLLTTLCLQWARYEGARVIVLDKGRSSRCATLASGGTFVELSLERPSFTFQPFARVDEPAELAFLAQWLEEVARLEGVEVGVEERALLVAALRSLAASPPHLRTFTTLTLSLQHRGLRAALEPFAQGRERAGVYAPLWDQRHEAFELSRWTSFELESLMESNPRLIAMTLRYLFHRIEQQLTGAPTLLVLDEAWLFLSHPMFAERIRQWLKVLRKLNVYVIFATQEISDALSSPIAPTLLQNCPTTILLPNARARTPGVYEAYQALGLTDGQIETIALSQPRRDYYLHSAPGSRLFTLGLSPLELALAASSPEAQARMDQALRMSAQTGRSFLSCYLELCGFGRYARQLDEEMEGRG